MKYFVNNIISTGVHQTNDATLKERILLLNTVTLVTIAFGLIYIVISYFIDQLFFVPILALNTFLVSLVFLFNHKGLYVLSRLYFLFLINIGLFANCILFGKDSGIHLFYLVSGSVPFIFFNRKEFSQIIASSILSIVLFAIVQLNLVSAQKELGIHQLELLYNVSMIASFIWTIFNFYYIGKKNDYAVQLINEQKETISKTLGQKETLLQEVHHRVKNNLQLVVSLLNLQSSTIENTEAKEKFEESANRIRSISSVHELLYSSKEFSTICLKDYTEELLESLITSIANSSVNVQHKFQIDNVRIDLSKAIPLGLIINEIFTNAIKHAIVEDTLRIELYLKNFGDRAELVIKDFGTGFNFDQEYDKDNSIGLLLISELTDQIDGMIAHESSENGTSYSISFEL